MEKLEGRSYQKVEKFENMFNRFDTIPACDRQTDGQTSCHGIVRAYADHRVVKPTKFCKD